MPEVSLTGAPLRGKTAGYFGKMPVRGDFLDSLPREFVDPWSDWIGLALESSRTQLAEGWLEAYLTSPVWHFALAPTVCGGTPWAGVLIPSVDAVGRYYPLTVAAPVGPETNVTTLLALSRPWLMKVEKLARSCLEDGFDLAAFDREIQALEPPAGESAATGLDEGFPESGGLLNAWRYGLDSPACLLTGSPALVKTLMDKLFFTYSLWWTAGSARVSPTLLVCQGLPPPEGYAAMLDGEWQKWGWEDKQVFEHEPPVTSG